MSERVTSFIPRLFDTSGFPARWRCGTWPEYLGWLHIVSDVVIFASYFAIPTLLLFFVLRRRNVPFNGVFWLFMAFILSCGITHLIDATIFYWPVYRLSGLMKAVTAVVSGITVLALVRVIPRALKLPDVVTANARLRSEIAEREEAERNLAKARADLEHRSSVLVVRNRRFSSALDAADVFACQWSVETGAMEWEVGVVSWLRRRGIHAAGPVASWSDILDGPQFTRFLDACRAAVAGDGTVDITMPLGDDGRLAVRLGARVDPPVTGQAPTITGMARLVAQAPA